MHAITQFQYFPHFPVVGQFFCYSKFVVNTEHVQNMLDFCGVARLQAD